MTRNPSWIALSPDARFLYAVSEIDELDGERTGGVHAFRWDADSGGLTPVNSMPSGGASPTHLAVEPGGRFLLVANFESGTVAVFALGDDGELLRMTDVVQHNGRGKDDFFQAGPHPHQIVFDPQSGEVLVPDMGLDAVFVYGLDDQGGLTESRSRIVLPPGTGPRHIALGADDQWLMVLGEVNNTLTVLRRDPSGAFTIADRLSSLPPGVERKTRAGGLVATADRNWFFASNRGHDSVSAFAWDRGTETLALRQTISSAGREPRGLAVSPDGTSLIIGNQDSDELTEFTIDETGLTLRSRTTSPSPACIVFTE